MFSMVLVFCAAGTTSAQVFMSEPEALKVLFPAATWTEEVKALDDGARAALGQSTRLRFAEPSYCFHVAHANGQVVGYALTLDEVGKSEPITLTVGLDATGKVTEVILLVYRESRGGEVRDKRFLKQFRGKTHRAPVQVDRDILNYSGATLSSQALARGVRKALALFEHFYGPGQMKPSTRIDHSASAPSSSPSIAAASPGPPGLPRQKGKTGAAPSRHVQARYLMGTICAVEVYARDREQAAGALDAAFEAMREVDHRMSLYRDDSELSRLNHRARQGETVQVSEELFRVLEFAQEVSEASVGTFDVTIGPLLRAWGFLPAGFRLAREGARLSPAVARAPVGYRKVQLDPAARTVRFTAIEVELDLGGIAKGYAVDRAVEAVRAWAIDAARVSAGGSTLYALGAPPGRPEGWRVALPTGETLTVRDAAVSSSGHKQRFVDVGSRRYSHIFDPRRGKPVSDQVSSVSVLAPSAMESDALTKPFFILSEPEQAKLLRHFPRSHVWIGRGRATRAARR